MGLWDEVDNIEVTNDEEAGNPYLTSPSKGLELIARLLPKNRGDEQAKLLKKIDYMLSDEILSTLRNLGKGASSLGRKLLRLNGKIGEYRKINMLSGKAIVGIGGKFSSGKSRFINSILGDREILPEDQNTTTSIPTYIIHGSSEEIQAYCGNNVTQLDLEAMQAMTHQFYDKYGIGFSRFVENIMIRTPNFPKNWKDGIAFLDTPGYNKSSRNTRDDLTDEYTTEQQLKAVDCLIWLVDIDNGVVHEEDIKFMGGLSLSNTPVLLVFNKADKKSESECESVISESRKILHERGISVKGLTAYSSKDRREYCARNLIREFLDMAASSKGRQSLGTELNGVITSIDDEFNKEIENLKERRNELGEYILDSQDITAIRSLVDVYGRVCQIKGRLSGNNNKFHYVTKKINASFAELSR